MNTKFTAAAQAIADHFKAAEAKRGEPFRATFTDPMNNDAVTPNSVGVPVALLRALVDAPAGVPIDPLQTAADAERFNVLAMGVLMLNLPLYEFFSKATEPTSLDELRALVDEASKLCRDGAA